jgi:hypothetical protein
MKPDYKKAVLNGSPLLHHVLSTHLLLEAYLRRELSMKLVKPDVLITDQSPSFSNLVNISEAIGVIESDVAKVLRTLNSIRNRYAHRLSFEASKDQVEAFLLALRQMNNPFYMSFVPGSEYELGNALAALAGWFQRRYGSLDLPDISNDSQDSEDD